MRYSILLIVAIFAGSVWSGEPIDDFLKASQLVRSRKFAEAAKLYEKLAGSVTDAEQLRTAHLYHAICLGRVSKQQEAMKAAELLKDPHLRAYAEMSILDSCGKSAEIVKRFANTDLNAWPEEYDHLGWYMRGRAFANQKQYDQGLQELARATELAGSDSELKMLAWMEGATVAHATKKDDLALQITGKSLKYSAFSSSYMFLRQMILRAEILIQRKQFDEAVQTLALAPANLGTKQGVWDWHFRMTQGNLALAKGNKAEAKKEYELARVCAGNMKHLLKECDEKLANLR